MRARAYSTCAGLMSTAVTECPAWASAKAVQPAEAIENTRPPGGKAASSMDGSSYMRPNRSADPPPRPKRPWRQGVPSSVGGDKADLTGGNPRERQKCD